MRFHPLTFLTTLGLLATANAATTTPTPTPQVGTLTALEGDVQLLGNPADQMSENVKLEPPATRARFEGKYYIARPARIGDRIERENVLRTSPNGKARVIFDNGDQYLVGPGTIYRPSWQNDAADTRTDIELRQGALRGVVTPGGPRKRLFIRTQTAVMGVRGTDFSIGTGVTAEGEAITEVSVLRGSVELSPTAKNEKAEPVKPALVERGYSAQISVPRAAPAASTSPTAATSPSPLSAPIVQVRPTTQEDLREIRKNSEVARAKQEDLLRATAPDAAATVKKLETRAGEATLRELKQADPQLYAQVQAKKVSDPDELNTLVVQKQFKDAPKAPPTKRKPYRGELEDLEKDAYDKYYKPEQ